MILVVATCGQGEFPDDAKVCLASVLQDIESEKDCFHATALSTSLTGTFFCSACLEFFETSRSAKDLAKRP